MSFSVLFVIDITLVSLIRGRSLFLNAFFLSIRNIYNHNIHIVITLLAPTGSLIVIMVYYISAAAAAATFSDFHSVHCCIDVNMLQVSFKVA